MLVASLTTTVFSLKSFTVITYRGTAIPQTIVVAYILAFILKNKGLCLLMVISFYC